MMDNEMIERCCRAAHNRAVARGARVPANDIKKYKYDIMHDRLKLIENEIDISQSNHALGEPS